MNKIIAIIFFLIFCVKVNSQTVTEEEKRDWIEKLSNPNLSQYYISKIIENNIKEAEQALIDNIWMQKPSEQIEYLFALYKFKSTRAISLMLEFYNHIDNYDFSEELLNALFYKSYVSTYLIYLGDCSKRQYVYEQFVQDIQSGVSGVPGLMGEILKICPGDSSRVSDLLMNAVLNAKYDDLRYFSLMYLEEIFKDKSIPTAINMFENDTTEFNRDFALDIVSKYKNPMIHQYLLNRVFIDNSESIKLGICSIILFSYGTPKDFKVVNDLLPNIMDMNDLSPITKYFLRKDFVSVDSSASIKALEDSLISYHAQCTSYNWLSNITFSDQLKTYLTEAKTKLASGDSLGTALKIKLYQNQIAEQYKDTVTTDGKIVTGDGHKFLYYYPKYILERLPRLPTVKFNDSQGKLLNGGTLQYYENGWKDAVSNNDGTFTVPTIQKTLSLRMNYAYGSQQKSNVTVGADTIVFQTVNSQVKLLDSKEAILDTGRVQYYSNGWRDYGTTANGTVSKELLPGTYTFKMNFAFASIDKQQNIETNPVVEFRTKAVNVKLNNSLGNPLDVGTVQYYSNGWRSFGLTANGVAVKELLPVNYTFKMNYGFASIDKQQNVSTNPVVEFNTALVNVKLSNSLGEPLDVGTVQYYSNGWRDFSTTTNGVAVKELLQVNYTFKMNYGFASIDKQQNVSTNPVIEFRTTLVSVKLSNSLGEPLDVGTVQYYSNGWRDIGVTANGVAVKELLPVNYTFKMNYGFASIDKQQNVSTNPVVEFQTTKGHVELRNSLSQLMLADLGTVEYYSNGWRDFGTTVNGVAEKELLPVNYTFKMNFGFASVDKQQNLSQNNSVVFQTVNALVQLKDSQGNPLDGGTVEYYSNGWRSFGVTQNGSVQKELLPASYTFKMTHAFVSNDKVQVIGTNNTITFSTTLCSINVKDTQNQPVNNASVSYYSNGWRAIGATVNGLITKELLPANLTFRAVSGSKQLDKTQNIGTNNNIEINLP